MRLPCTNDNLILTTFFNNLNNSRHLRYTLCHLFRRTFFQSQTQSRCTVCCTYDIFLTNSVLDISCQFRIITNFCSCHFLPPVSLNSNFRFFPHVYFFHNSIVCFLIQTIKIQNYSRYNPKYSWNSRK